jgi:phosphoribosyl-ATP pyrophosphohydrolase/phosphoribosyl-AMP cyclohydrolase
VTFDARAITEPTDVARLAFQEPSGLLPQVAQDAYSGEILMLGYANGEAVKRTLESGRLWFWSRQRQRLWQKGESSGNVLRLVSLHADCDADSLVALVRPSGPTCHTGSWSCFEAPPTLAALGRVLKGRAAAPNEASYTSKLLADENLRLKKLGEEAVELALACTNNQPERAAEEAADLLYHALVACQAVGAGLGEVLEVLNRRLGAGAAGR